MSWLLSPAADTIEIGDLKDVVITGAVKGDIIAFDASDWVDVTVGANNLVLTADSTAAAGVKWAAVSVSEINDLTAAVIWANIPDANVPESAVTQHEGAIDHDVLLNFVSGEHFLQSAISITASQVSDFDTEVANNAAVTANTAKVTNATHTGQVTGSGALALDVTAITAQTELAAGLVSTDELLVNDGGVLSRMDISVIEAYMQANLSFLTSFTEVNDLTAAVTWANVPDANITQSSVTQHEAALTILETQITDGALLARLAEVETITANWAFEGNIDIRDGNSLSIRDATNADRIVISHDGVDLVIGHTGTTDWNITGLTAIQAGTVDADFDAITATSYGGITEANLVDKSAVETISGAWTFDANVVVDNGNSLSVFDSTTTDKVVFSHDGTDFNIAGTTTTDINVTGIAGFNVVNYNFDVDQTVGAGQDNFVLTYDDASGLISLEAAAGGGGDKVYRIGHTYAIVCEIKVPSGQDDFIIPFFVSLVSGQTAKLVKARHIINDGTSVTCKLQKNGADITGFTGISVTTTAADTDPSDVTLADNDKLALVVTAVSGTPKNMSFTLFIEYTQ